MHTGELTSWAQSRDTSYWEIKIGSFEVLLVMQLDVQAMELGNGLLPTADWHLATSGLISNSLGRKH